MVKHLDWHHLYSESWKNEIAPAAFQHPAKYSRALIRHIYEYLIKEKMVKPGDVVLDPFGGVALGGLDAARMGLHFIGCELEEKFVVLGNQNIALWNSRYAGKMPRWGSARLVQGDSRHLRSVIAAAECAVSSPPYAESFAHDAGGNHKETYVNHYGGGDVPPRCYSDNPANLGNLKGDGFEAAVSSPPYEEARIGQESGQEHCGHNDAYGGTPGQMGAMKSGGYDAAVSSPPYEGSPLTYEKNGLLEDGKRPYKRDYMDGNSENYGGNKENIANADDFWSAAKQVVAETYAVLAPGAVAVWVTKRFVRGGKIVEFSQQWAQLCEAVGFKQTHWIKAWLVEDNGTQLGFETNRRRVTSRKSFFRRLHEKKHPETAIDWEDVLIMVKR